MAGSTKLICFFLVLPSSKEHEIFYFIRSNVHLSVVSVIITDELKILYSRPLILNISQIGKDICHYKIQLQNRKSYVNKI